MSRQISRLSTVCKVLFNAEVIALRNENEELRLILFWMKYSAKKLRSAIERGNKKMSGIPRNCNCATCSEADRYWGEDEDNPNEICAWRPLFEAKLVELGIGFCNKPQSEARIRCEPDIYVVPDCDTHIVNLLGDGQCHFYNWFDFAYGSKLYEVTTVNDPELQKLVALFEWLVPSDESTD